MRVTTIGLRLVLFAICAHAAVAGAMAQPEQIVQVLPRDAIPAIDRPVFEPAATATGFDANELMIGLVGAREHRAYSTWQLDRHEIVNDIFEDRPIAVTW